MRNKGAWPAIRTSRNPMAAPSNAVRKKNDWADQRSQFILGTFAVLAKMFENPIDADAVALAKHKAILAAIERLRVDAAQAMTDGVFSKEVTFPVIIAEDPSKDHKKAFLKTTREWR